MCEKKINVPALFGEMVFGEQQMQQRLPADVYRAWQQSLAQGTALDRSVAGEIAGAMKDWAIEKGATPPTGTRSCKWPASTRASYPSWRRC